MFYNITMSRLVSIFCFPLYRLYKLVFVGFTLPGSLSIVLKITPPYFDQFCEPMGYRVMVDNETYASLPLDTKKYCMKV